MKNSGNRHEDALAVHYNQGSYPAYLGQEELSEMMHFRTLTHWHEEFEFLRVLSGGMLHEIEGVTVELTAGDLLFVNVHRMHRSKRMTRGGQASACVFQIMQFHPSALYGDLVLTRRTVLPLMNSRNCSYVHIAHDDPDAETWHTLFDLCFRFAGAADAERSAGLTGAAYMLLALLTGACRREILPETGSRDSTELRDVRRMLSYIHANYQEKIGLDDIAREIAASRSRCARLFRKYMDHAPVEFLNIYRLQAASEKLLDGTETIASIALSCGFSDQSYFGKAFQKAYSMSPGKYRALGGRVQVTEDPGRDEQQTQKDIPGI